MFIDTYSVKKFCNQNFLTLTPSDFTALEEIDSNQGLRKILIPNIIRSVLFRDFLCEVIQKSNKRVIVVENVKVHKLYRHILFDEVYKHVNKYDVFLYNAPLYLSNFTSPDFMYLREGVESGDKFVVAFAGVS